MQTSSKIGFVSLILFQPNPLHSLKVFFLILQEKISSPGYGGEGLKDRIPHEHIEISNFESII